MPEQASLEFFFKKYPYRAFLNKSPIIVLLLLTIFKVLLLFSLVQDFKLGLSGSTILRVFYQWPQNLKSKSRFGW